MLRMERCFRYFDKIQHDLQKGAILLIIRHWKKYLVRVKEERANAKKKGKSKKSVDSKKKKSGTDKTSGKASQNQALSQASKRSSIGKQARQTNQS